MIKANSSRWFLLDDLSNEEWKDIDGYEEKYQISNYGRVKTLYDIKWNKKIYKEKILSAKTTGKYLHVSLSKKSIKKNFLIHRLVASAFLLNPCNYSIVNHKDENKKNNYVDNLEWCTYTYNNNYGKRNKKAKEKLSIKINQYDLKGNYIKTWNSMNDAIRYYHNNHICNVCKKQRKSACGYKWEYANKEDI